MNVQFPVLALDRRCADTWRRVFGSDLDVTTDDHSPNATLAVALETPDLFRTLAHMLQAYRGVIVVADGPVDAHLDMKLISSGLIPYSHDSGAFYTSDFDRERDEVPAALVGPLSAKTYAGLQGTTSGGLTDLATRHRLLIADDTPFSGWAEHTAARSSGLWIQLSSAERVRIPPLFVDGDPRVVIDRPDPGPLLIVGDCDQQHLSNVADGLPPTLASQPALVSAKGPVRDPVTTERRWRRDMLGLARQSSGILALRDAFRSDADRAAVVIDAVSRSVPVAADRPEGLAGYLGDMTVDALAPCTPEAFSGLFGRDRWATRQFRAAAVEEMTSPLLPGTWSVSTAAPPKVSVVLATMRPWMVASALKYLDAQTYPSFEVVVVVHGHDLKSEWERDWNSSVGAPLVVTDAPTAHPLGLVYNAGVAVSSGEVVVIWDDDDHYGPNHLWDLVIALRRSRAELVGKGAEFFFLEGSNLTIQRPPSGRFHYSNFVGGSNLTIRKGDLLELGGFGPLTHGVDREMLRRTRASGGRSYRDHGYGYLVHRRADGHTWDPGDAYFVGSAVRQWPGLEKDAAGIDGEVG